MSRTLVARDFGSDDVADLAAGSQVGHYVHVCLISTLPENIYRVFCPMDELTAQISRDACGEEAARRDG